MPVSRQCSRTACSRDAVATLTYVYSDSTVVLGPLAIAAEPHSYDLCEEHASRLTAPRGWEVVRVVAASGQVPMDSLSASEGGALSAPSAAEEVEARRLEISRPLQRPDDDWAILADVVSSPSEAATIEISRDAVTGLRGVDSSGERPRVAPGQRVPELRSVPRGVARPGGNQVSDSDASFDASRPDVVVAPRHAADPAPVQEGEIMRRGHLRVLRGEASS